MGDGCKPRVRNSEFDGFPSELSNEAIHDTKDHKGDEDQRKSHAKPQRRKEKRDFEQELTEVAEISVSLS